MTPAKLRKLVEARDGGICALCHADTEAVRVGYLGAIEAARARHAAVMERETGWRVLNSANLKTREIRDAVERLERIGFSAKEPLCLWNADHYPPLDEGGKNELASVRTLCTRCHARVTAEQAARRTRRPKKRLWIHGQDRQGRPRIIQ